MPATLHTLANDAGFVSAGVLVKDLRQPDGHLAHQLSASARLTLHSLSLIGLEI